MALYGNGASRERERRARSADLRRSCKQCGRPSAVSQMHMPLGGSEQIHRQLLTPLTAPAHLSFVASNLKFRILSGGIYSSRYLYFQQNRLSRPAPISVFRYRDLAWGRPPNAVRQSSWQGKGLLSGPTTPGHSPDVRRFRFAPVFDAASASG